MGLLDNIQRLHSGMDYHLARQNLLTANLSQLDTPGFRPLDLERVRGEGFGGVLHVELRRTSAGHLSGHNPTGASQVGRVVVDSTAIPGPDGNAVSVDREAVKIASNQIRYDALAGLVASSLSGLQWAANDGRTG